MSNTTVLRSPGGASATVHHLGATVISWKTPTGKARRNAMGWSGARRGVAGNGAERDAGWLGTGRSGLRGGWLGTGRGLGERWGRGGLVCARPVVGPRALSLSLALRHFPLPSPLPPPPPFLRPLLLQEMLHTSSKASFAPGGAIRGGVPVCWPQFGPVGPWPKQHGFARNLPWSVAELGADRARFELRRAPLRPGDASPAPPEAVGEPAAFPSPFVLSLSVHVSDDRLEQTLRVENPASAPGPLRFTAALHTYLAVEAGARRAAVRGLRGVSYVDNLDKATKTDEQDAVRFPGEVDRLYADAPTPLFLEDPEGRPRVRLDRRGFPDAVTWNPAEAKAAAMADLDDWSPFVCLESANAAHGQIQLAPGETWEGWHQLVDVTGAASEL